MSRHPIFARSYDRLAQLMEPEAAAYRRELLGGLSGRVIEIGAGNGINFQHYPATVDEIVALEPEPYLRAKAEHAAHTAAARVAVHDGVAEQLPFDDDCFDAGVISLVLCSVADQARALEELRRVLRPGAELRFFEHVRSTGRRKAAVQHLVDRFGIWSHLAGGCQCGRDTLAAMDVAGGRVERVRCVDLGPAWLFTNPYVIGRARFAGSNHRADPRNRPCRRTRRRCRARRTPHDQHRAHRRGTTSTAASSSSNRRRPELQRGLPRPGCVQRWTR